MNTSLTVSVVLLLFGSTVPVTALAQTQPGSQQQTGSISGIVRDASTHAPLADVRIIYAAGEETTTDAQGRFTFVEVEPGSRWVSAYDERRAAHGGVYVLVNAGQQATAEIHLKLGGVITGRVVDEDGKPVAGVAVLLLSSRYQWGELAYTPFQTVSTGEDGAFRLEGVYAERRFLVLAKKMLKATDAKEVPADPDKREHVLLPSLFPNARGIQDAQTLMLSPGETRTGVQIRMAGARSYCVSGTVDGIGDAQELSVALTERLSFDSGWALTPASVKVTSAGEFRACGLHPGEYHLSVSSKTTDRKLNAVADVTITDRDVSDIKLLGRPALEISGELVYDPPPREKSAEVRLFLRRNMHGGIGEYVDSVTKAANLSMFGALTTVSRIAAAGAFIAGRVAVDDWQVDVRGPEGCYVRKAQYGNQNVLREPLRLGQSTGEERLRILIGCDGGALTARVNDKDGNPVSHLFLYLMAADAASEGAFALSLRRTEVVKGWSDPMSGLPPGKYRALATDLDLSPLYASSDFTDKLWRVRGKAKEVEIGPGATIQIALEPVRID